MTCTLRRGAKFARSIFADRGHLEVEDLRAGIDYAIASGIADPARLGIGGERMYQALRSLGVPTQLIVFPGEHHLLDRPSFLVDRYARYLDRMNKYLGDPRG